MAAAAPSPPPSLPAQTREPFDAENVPYAKSRDDLRRYAAFANSKALAISTSGVSWWSRTPRQALEACEFWVRQPCILYAVDNSVEPAPDGRRPPRPTLGSGEGRFVPAEVPFVSDTVRQTLSAYLSAADTKALAVSPHGNYGLAGDAATIEEAQRLALERCSTAENRMAIPDQYKKPCYVYAIGDTVVLAKRLTAPIAAQH
jgi:hypothetical protein